jgi:Putative zinc ribbon domain
MPDRHCPSCGSCGFPMEAKDDFAGGNPDAAYCSTCADPNGQLKPFDTVVALNADYFVRHQGVDLSAAVQLARALLQSMPVWAGKAATRQ